MVQPIFRSLVAYSGGHTHAHARQHTHTQTHTHSASVSIANRPIFQLSLDAMLASAVAAAAFLIRRFTEELLLPDQIVGLSKTARSSRWIISNPFLSGLLSSPDKLTQVITRSSPAFSPSSFNVVCISAARLKKVSLSCISEDNPSAMAHEGPLSSEGLPLPSTP